MGDKYSSRGGAAGRSRAARWWLPGLLGTAAIGAGVGFYLLDFGSKSPVEVARNAPASAPVAIEPQAQPSAKLEPAAVPDQPSQTKTYTGKLAEFYTALAGLQSGTATSPVTILHLGDSHIASDRITGEVRHLLQARFGDAGRGLMMPGFPFPYYKAPGFSFEKTGEWAAANALLDEEVFGISGVSLTTSSPEATLTLTATDAPFASAEVEFLGAPGNGSATITAGSLTKAVSTSTDQRSIIRVPLNAEARSLKIKVKGDGPITVLGWSVDSGKSGVRYVNLGIPGASALTTNRFDRALAKDDIEALAPKLVVLGYGTNEGFIAGLDLEAYEKGYEDLIALIKDAAPDASLVILGPLDGARLPRFVKGEDKANLPCRPRSESEAAADYDALVAAKDPSVAHWTTPPKLGLVRQKLKALAERYGAFYWDMSSVMGGPCGIEHWVKATPPLAFPDHVHLTDEGSQRVGAALYKALIADYERQRQEAGNSGALTPEASSSRLAER
jgi:lysophospholipase L1-like esterase